MALPTENEVCRKCGGRMVSGDVRGFAGPRHAAILFTPADSPKGFSEGLRLTPVHFGPSSPRLPALLCPSCGIVEFRFPVDKVKPIP